MGGCTVRQREPAVRRRLRAACLERRRGRLRARRSCRARQHGPTATRSHALAAQLLRLIRTVFPPGNFVPPRRRSFIKNNLAVEISSSARLARVLGWLLRRHSMLAYGLYCAGGRGRGRGGAGWRTLACRGGAVWGRGPWPERPGAWTRRSQACGKARG